MCDACESAHRTMAPRGTDMCDRLEGWILSDVTATREALKYGRNATYRLHVKGRNMPSNEYFSWTVPDIRNPRYCTCHANIAPDALPFLNREVTPCPK